MFSVKAYAQTATTGKHCIACLTAELYEDILKFSYAEDAKSAKAYIDSGKCFILKEGIKVTITKPPKSIFFDKKLEFAYKGIKLWTNSGNLENWKAY